jgi:hypothetical protein
MAVTGLSVKAVLAPWAQRNPLGLVLTAFVAGGLMNFLRPWRWIPLSALLAGLLPQILFKLVAQVQPASWVEILHSLLQQGLKTKE